MLEWRLAAYRRWLTMTEPTWAKVHYPKIDFQDIYYYSAPKSTKGPKSLDEVDPELLATYEKLGIPLREREVLARRPGRAGRGRRRVRFGVGGHDLPRGAEEGRRALLLDVGGDPRLSGDRPEVSRLGGAGHRQLLRHAQLGRLLGRLLRLCAGGRPLPDGAVHLFPHQRAEHRPVRAYPDHRREGGLRLLSRGLHRADARREPAPCGGGRAGRAGRRRDQVLDRPELVPRQRRGQGRRLQLRHQARRLPRRRGRRSRGPRSRPARRSPGSTRA